ncbi:MAG: restriction endonuclease subunit S [Opitutus sp.]|nr:restriction endonuclease subunit S [Opitutus sp.]
MKKNLPPTWATVRLKELARSRMGKTILKSDLTETGLPVYSAGASTEPWGRLDGCEVSYGANTLVISARGNIGMPKRPRQIPFVCTQTTIACSAYLPETVDWLFWFLSQFDYSTKSSQTTIPMLRTSDVDSFEIPLPPLAEQKRIVAKIEELFSELEAGEESLRAARRQLGVYRQSLLKQAFEGKLTETWRAENPDKLESPAQLLARIQAARQAYYEQQLKDWECAIKVWSEAGQKGNRSRKPSEPMMLPLREFEGDITRPECWAIEQIGNCPTDALIGLVRSADEQTAGPSGFSYIKMDRVDMQGNVDISPSVFVDCTPEEVERFALKKGDILFNTRNSVELVGKVGIVRREPNSPTVYNNNLMRIRLPDCFDPVFVGLQLCAQPFRQRMDRIKKATTSVAAVYAKDFWPLPLAICSLPEQQEIVRLLDEQFEAIDRNEREIDAALKRSEALRQAILKKAFTGQLVPQDPADEPASELLARLRSEGVRT